MRTYFLSFISLLFVIFAFSFCKRSEQEHINKIEQLIHNDKINKANEYINELLVKTNNLLSERIHSDASTKNLTSSLDGRIAAWSVADDFYYFLSKDKQARSIDLDGSIVSFVLSSSGRVASIIYNDDDECHLVIFNIPHNSITQPHIGNINCNDRIIVSDDGKFVYRHRDEKVTVWDIQDSANNDFDINEQKTAHLSLPQNIYIKKTTGKYKKLRQKTILHQINQRSWVTFLGSAGAYKLIYYPGFGENTLSRKQIFSKPVLFPIFNGDLFSQNREGDPHPTNSSFLFESAQAFAYTGGSGKRQLRAIVFDGKIKVGKNFKSPVWDHLQFIRKKGEFIVLKNKSLYFWNPISNKRTQLPLLARGFTLFQGGLIYLDLTNNLYIRKQTFTNMEIKLVKLRKLVDKKRIEK